MVRISGLAEAIDNRGHNFASPAPPPDLVLDFTLKPEVVPEKEVDIKQEDHLPSEASDQNDAPNTEILSKWKDTKAALI